MKGIRVVVEQMKRRQAIGFEKFAIRIWYDQEEKNTYFEFDGFDEKAESATSKTKGLIIGKMQQGEEYLMKDLKAMAGTSSNLYNAIKELVEVDKVVGVRAPLEDEELENGHKIPRNAKIYFLTISEPVQSIQNVL